jgi:hypothetical protein
MRRGCGRDDRDRGEGALGRGLQFPVREWREWQADEVVGASPRAPLARYRVRVTATAAGDDHGTTFSTRNCAVAAPRHVLPASCTRSVYRGWPDASRPQTSPPCRSSAGGMRPDHPRPQRPARPAATDVRQHPRRAPAAPGVELELRQHPGHMRLDGREQPGTDLPFEHPRAIAGATSRSRAVSRSIASRARRRRVLDALVRSALSDRPDDARPEPNSTASCASTASCSSDSAARWSSSARKATRSATGSPSCRRSSRGSSGVVLPSSSGTSTDGSRTGWSSLAGAPAIAHSVRARTVAVGRLSRRSRSMEGSPRGDGRSPPPQRTCTA